MGTIVTQGLSIVTGAKPTLSAATASDEYDCGPGCFAVIAVGATSTGVTVVDPRTLETGAAAPDVTYAGLTNTEKWIPLPSYLANANGKATITTTQQTAVTCAGVAFR